MKQMQASLAGLVEAVREAERDVRAHGGPEEEELWERAIRPRILGLPTLSRGEQLALVADLDRLSALRTLRAEHRAADAARREAASLIRSN